MDRRANAPKGRKFDVRISRTEIRHYHLEVEAGSKAEARAKALDAAGGLDFYSGSCSEPEYGVEEVNETE
jgi:hypothetical protein